MFATALASLLVFSFFKFVDKEKTTNVYVALTFILIPAILIFLLRKDGLANTLPNGLSYGLDALYFIVPLVTIKTMSAYCWLKSLLYAAIVCVIAILSQFLVLIVSELLA